MRALRFLQCLLEQYFDLRPFFFRQMLEFPPPCAILFLSYSSPPWFWVCDYSNYTTSAMTLLLSYFILQLTRIPLLVSALLTPLRMPFPYILPLERGTMKYSAFYSVFDTFSVYKTEKGAAHKLCNTAA